MYLYRINIPSMNKFIRFVANSEKFKNLCVTKQGFTHCNLIFRLTTPGDFIRMTIWKEVHTIRAQSLRTRANTISYFIPSMNKFIRFVANSAKFKKLCVTKPGFIHCNLIFRLTTSGDFIRMTIWKEVFTIRAQSLRTRANKIGCFG